MPGLMSRAATIIKAKFSALLNRAENPQETLDYSYERQLESLQNVKRGVADVVTAKKRLQLQTQQLEQNVVKLDTQARQAVAAGRDDLTSDQTQLDRELAQMSSQQQVDQELAKLKAEVGSGSDQAKELSQPSSQESTPSGG